MIDVAQAADVSDQTVYNYFPAKHDFVLDRADEIRERYRRTVADRPTGMSPAAALRELASEDIERFRGADLELALGEFPALCVSSANIRRYALEARDQQTETVAAAIIATCPNLHPAILRTHAAALISVFQMIVDRIGRGVLDRAAADGLADELAFDVEVALTDLDRHFLTLVALAPDAW